MGQRARIRKNRNGSRRYAVRRRNGGRNNSDGNNSGTRRRVRVRRR